MALENAKKTVEEFIAMGFDRNNMIPVGVDMSSAESIRAAVEEVIGQVVANQDEVVVAGMKISTREQAAKSGVTALKGGIEWSTPAMIVPTVKFLKSKKTELSVEI